MPRVPCRWRGPHPSRLTVRLIRLLRQHRHSVSVSADATPQQTVSTQWNTTLHTFNSPFSGTTRVSQHQNIKPILILRKQETVSGSGISWAICKSAPRSRQPRQHPTTQLIQAGCPSWHPTDSVKALESVHSKKLQYNMIQDTILTCAQKLT